MATRNIQMNYYNGTNYDVLYPQTNMSQVDSLNSTISGIQSSVSGFQSQLNGKLNLSGGTMTGNLTLRGDPTSALMAATKGYVDNSVNNTKNNILESLFFTEVISKEFLFNLTWDGSGAIANGSVTTNLENLITEKFSRIVFITIMTEWELHTSSTSKNEISLTFAEDINSDFKFSFYETDNTAQQYNIKTSYSFTSDEIYSTNSRKMTSYDSGKMMYLNSFSMLCGVADNHIFQGSANGTMKINFYIL